MKEELLEAIYGTVERLEQKVDELSASPKYAGAETVPASNDTTKLEKSIIAMFGKEEEVRGKISKLRDAIVVFVDLIKAELGKNEQRSKLLVDAVKQMRQENDVSSKALQDKLEVMNNSPQKKLVPIASSLHQSMFFFSLAAWLYLLSFPFGAISPNGESIKIGRRQI